MTQPFYYPNAALSAEALRSWAAGSVLVSSVLPHKHPEELLWETTRKWGRKP